MNPNVKKRPFFKRRPKTTLFITLLIIAIVYIAVCAFTVLGVLAFRRHPQRTVALTYFSGDAPHKILGRAIMFRKGVEYYNSDLLQWANDSKVLSDSSWNRWILERHVENVSAGERNTLLANYPLTPTDRMLPFLKEALAQNQYAVLPVLGRADSAQARDIYRRWVEEKVVKPRDQKLFVAASGALAQSTTYSFPELLASFWPQLSPAQRERVILKMTAHLKDETKAQSEAFAWTESSLPGGAVKTGCGAAALNGRFLSVPSIRQRALQHVARQASSIKDSHVFLLFEFTKPEDQVALATALMETFKGKNDPALLEVIHHIAHTDISKAEQLAGPLLAGGDSELRKGAIVMLVRHNSTMAKGMIDETFKGTFPRKTLYLTSDNYSNGSAAAELYNRLATHDYQETGKTWPPSYSTGGPSANEVHQWREFINTYPWFPGTDDAYYRLAFSQFAQKDYQSSLSTIKEYLKRDYWPDNDARQYMMHLVRQLAVSTDISDPAFPYLAHIRNIANRPLASRITNSSNSADTAVQSMDWFLSHPEYLTYLNTDSETLKLMREAAVLFQTTPSDSICHLIAGKFDTPRTYRSFDDSDESTSEEYVDEEPEWDEKTERISNLCSEDGPDEDLPIHEATPLQSILYGVFRIFPSPASTAVKINLPSDPGDEAVRQTAAFLNSKLSGASVVAIRDRSLDETIVLALLHSGTEYEKWAQELNPTLDFLLSISNRDIPSVVSKRHANLLKTRK